jgi:resuscitation-promoting factor RpfA
MIAQIEGATLLPAQATRARRRVHIHKTRAPFSLRCGALLIDYILLMAVIAGSTLIARMLGGGARTAGTSTETIGMVVVVLLVILNFGVLAGLTGQTIGKWATGLRIERTGGQGLDIGRSLLRHFVGYPLSLLTLGIGFLIAVVSGSGRALHDLIADTVVVRDEVVTLNGER